MGGLSVEGESKRYANEWKASGSSCAAQRDSNEYKKLPPTQTLAEGGWKFTHWWWEDDSSPPPVFLRSLASTSWGSHSDEDDTQKMLMLTIFLFMIMKFLCCCCYDYFGSRDYWLKKIALGR